MKRFVWSGKHCSRLLLTALAIITCLGFQPSANAAPIVLRIAHGMAPDHSYQKWLDDFTQLLKAKVGDRVEIKVFPAAQLGTETQYLENMKLGALDGAVLGRHGEVDIRLDVLNLPLIFKDAAHVDKVLRSGGPLEKHFNDILLSKGYVNLGWGELGFREITSNVPIHNVNDLQGLTIRVPNAPVLVAAFKAWGANPVALDLSEVYTGLRTGVVKAQENPPETIYKNKYYEVQKYLSMTDHSTIVNQFLISKKKWDTLPKDIQEAMLEVGRVSRDNHVKFVRQANADMVIELEKQGMTVVRDVDRSTFTAGAKAVQDQFSDKFGADVIQSIVDAGK